MPRIDFPRWGELYTAKGQLPIDCIAKTSVAESRDERANNVESGLALPAIICPTNSSIASPFVLGKPVKIGESGTRKFFSLALTGLQPPLQMAFQQALSTISNVDIAMRRQIDGPSRMDRLSKGNFIDHPPSSIKSDYRRQLTLSSEVSYFSRCVRGFNGNRVRSGQIGTLSVQSNS
jgi:hypothetical protein